MGAGVLSDLTEIGSCIHTFVSHVVKTGKLW